MQKPSSLQHTGSREEGRRASHQGDVPCYNGEHIAKIFKFYRRLQNPYVSHDLPVKLVPARDFYREHKESFDKFAELASKNNFDVDQYMKYCVSCGIDERLVEKCLKSTMMLNKYEAYVAKREKRKKIYRWFVNSAKNIAEECIDEGYFTTKDLLRDLIRKQKLSGYIITGRISIYYFAAIPNFDKAIPKLDYFSQMELQQLQNHFEIYHSEVNKAFIQVKNCMVNPIDFTDRLICKMRDRKKKIE